MNSSNSTQKIDYLFEVIIRIDHTFRYASVLVHIVYFIVMILSKELKKRTFLFTNHACLVSVVYCLITLYFTFNDHPSFGNETINEIICSIIEIGWIFSSYIRMYSILLIAVYRYIAVFNVKLYKTINYSNFYLISPIIVVWFISISLPFISKYLFGTSVSPFLCLDGFSTIFSNTLMYFFFNYFFMIITPSVVIIFIYSKIILKLSSLGLNVKRSRFEKIFEKSQIKFEPRTIMEIKNFKKQKRFANQFILMCFSVIASSIVLSIFTLRNLIPNFLQIFFYWRPIFRVYILSAICIIPILGLFYHPNRSNLIKRVLKSNSIETEK
ncbi:unnamed protein product [Brachionus calyciflorus]|uniref:G-protein coupled receptors family 1 profile domain-containing protein n=1 Tax=Brachionus calyciflorus TaxID=104777 RepID=A0A814A1P3_9BILA|nr:unnamed protein product [Brachionus calyciflorus]